MLLPDGDGIAISGGDNWTGTGTTNTGNNNANLFDVATRLDDARQQHEPRALVLQRRRCC